MTKWEMKSRAKAIARLHNRGFLPDRKRVKTVDAMINNNLSGGCYRAWHNRLDEVNVNYLRAGWQGRLA